jgi:ribonuclease P protein component
VKGSRIVAMPARVIHSPPPLSGVDNCPINSCNSALFQHDRRPHEAHLPTIGCPAKAAARLSRSDAHSDGSCSHQRTPGERPQSPGSVKARAKLPRGARLSSPEQFTGQFARRLQGRWFQVLARPNAQPNFARLGLIVGRKAAPRAVDRSRTRRVAREEFRKLRGTLGAMDVVVRLRAPVEASERASARNELRDFLSRLTK